MATNQLSQVIQTLRRAARPLAEAGRTDGQLLESYVRSREEAAFVALVQRHGPMVWGVCRRVVFSHQDAEDAFQATFLVLIRKAASVKPREMVGNWLYGVAHQTALKARAAAARRWAREKQVPAMPEPALEGQELQDDLQPLLDQELSRLPGKYRAVLVLCDLEGKTRKEAARQFRVPEGTVASRLATARGMLAKRLKRHGLLVTGAALAELLSQAGASAGMPAAVVSNTIKAARFVAAGKSAVVGSISARAAALAEGVIRSMLLTKLKIVSAVFVAMVLLGAGAGALTHLGSAGQRTDPLSPEQERPQALVEPPGDQPATPKKEPAGPPAERKEAEALPTIVRGVVKAVDVGNGSLTVVQGAGETSFRVAKDGAISIDGKQGQLAGLPPGANVILSQFVDPKTARNVDAGGRWYYSALLEAVDAEKHTITIQDKEGQRTFSVAPDACVSVDGKQCQLAALPAGAVVHVGLGADQTTIRSVGAQGPHLGECGGSLVKAVDAEMGTITFDEKASADVAGKTFSVAKNANIVIDGKPGKLAEVPPGSYVNLTLSVDRQAALQVHAQGPDVPCDCGGSMVKAVDAEGETITFDDRARAQVAGKTFAVAKDALVAIDGRPGKLADLPSGCYVSAKLRVDQKTIGTIRAQGPRVPGVVKRVDADKATVTVDETTYAVAKDAVIVIDGKPGPLAGLAPGTAVVLSLHIDRKTAGAIQTKAP